MRVVVEVVSGRLPEEDGSGFQAVDPGRAHRMGRCRHPPRPAHVQRPFPPGNRQRRLLHQRPWQQQRHVRRRRKSRRASELHDRDELFAGDTKFVVRVEGAVTAGKAARSAAAPSLPCR